MQVLIHCAGTRARAGRAPHPVVMHAATRRLKEAHDAIEHVFGVITPALGALTLLDFFGLLEWTWLFFFWLACGHWAAYGFDAYPRLPHRPFVRGLFAFGFGVLWPLWLATRAHGRRRAY